jgi:multiple sugar transport system permease protein
MGDRALLGALRAALRTAVLVLFLTPVAFMVLGSLRDPGRPPPKGLELLPEDAGAAAYRELADHLPVGTLLQNSALVVLVAVPVTVLIASWAGFALAQLPDRSRRLLLGLTLAMLVVPLPLLWVPRFALYEGLGVLDSLVPLMAPALAATTPFTVLVSYRAFRRVDPELYDAARLEGASALATWRRVGLPLVRSTTTAVTAIAFALHWGNYLDALLYVQSPQHRTFPLGLAQLRGLDSNDMPILLAGAVALTLPALVLLAAVQRPLLSSAGARAD